MDFWNSALIKPDADIQVLVCTLAEERAMASWNGEQWVTAEDETPLQGHVTHWIELEKIPMPHELSRIESDRSYKYHRLEEDVTNLRERLDNYCDGCDLLKFTAQIRCSDCCEMVSEEATVETPDYRRLCPSCASKRFKEVQP
jgi:hypothetical protein